jgi:hypothetical protein
MRNVNFTGWPQAAGPTQTCAPISPNVALFAGMLVLIAIPFSFVCHRTGGSVFMTSLLHATVDTPEEVWLPLLLPVGAHNTTTGEGRVGPALLVMFRAVAVLIVAHPRTPRLDPVSQAPRRG